MAKKKKNPTAVDYKWFVQHAGTGAIASGWETQNDAREGKADESAPVEYDVLPLNRVDKGALEEFLDRNDLVLTNSRIREGKSKKSKIPPHAVPASKVITALTMAVLGSRTEEDNLYEVGISLRPDGKYPRCQIYIYNQTEDLDENEEFMTHANHMLAQVTNRKGKSLGLYLDNAPPLFVAGQEGFWIENDFGTGERVDLRITHDPKYKG